MRFLPGVEVLVSPVSFIEQDLQLIELVFDTEKNDQSLDQRAQSCKMDSGYRPPKASSQRCVQTLDAARR